MKQTMRKKKSRTGSKAYIILAGVEKRRVNGQSSVDEMQQTLFDFHKNEIPKYEIDKR